MPTINRPKKNNERKKSNNKRMAQSIVYNTKRWSELRRYKIYNNPLCEQCLIEDRITPAVEVHHITPFMTGSNVEQIKFLGFDYSNLMCLCTECHSKKHIKNNQ